MFATGPWEAVVHVSHSNSAMHAVTVSLSEKSNNLFEGLYVSWRASCMLLANGPFAHLLFRASQDSKIDTECNQTLHVHGIELISHVNTNQTAPQSLQVVLQDDLNNKYFNRSASLHQQGPAQHGGQITVYSLPAPASAPIPPQNRAGSCVLIEVKGQLSNGVTMAAYIRLRELLSLPLASIRELHCDKPADR